MRSSNLNEVLMIQVIKISVLVRHCSWAATKRLWKLYFGAMRLCIVRLWLCTYSATLYFYLLCDFVFTTYEPALPALPTLSTPTYAHLRLRYYDGCYLRDTCYLRYCTALCVYTPHTWVDCGRWALYCATLHCALQPQSALRAWTVANLVQAFKKAICFHYA